MQSLQDKNEQILRRFSVFDLTEFSEIEGSSHAGIKIESHGVGPNCINWWALKSGANHYVVHRLFNFVWCSCRAFFFTRKICKHLQFIALGPDSEELPVQPKLSTYNRPIQVGRLRI